ncbi:alkaline phosphatase family protein [Mycobacterium sp.]|uniref:alkaline phosphatase family protein n=1 Tax=Mycobacterium sp. TaxID=1785 RepID=UPI003A8394A2
MAGSICDVLPSLAALFGAPGATDTLELADSLAGVDRVCIVLVDGLGWHLLPDLADDAPLLASVLNGSTGRLRQLDCTFPSTTPTNLVSLGTGVRPGQHGVLGFTLNIPGTDRVFTHTHWRDDPPHTEWQPVPTWFGRLAEFGVGATAVIPDCFLGTGLTESAFRGARFSVTRDGDDYPERLVAEVRAAPELVYGYTGALDTAAHVFGVGSPQWHEAASWVDALLTRVAEALPAGAALIVTADHGGINIAREKFLDIDADPRLAAGVRVVAGEPRVRYLHTEPGATADVLATWTELLAGRAEVRSRDDMVATGVFGPVAPRNLPRIGDVVVTCTAETAILATRRESPNTAKLVGFHGAASPAEMAIPLIVIPAR